MRNIIFAAALLISGCCSYQYVPEPRSTGWQRYEYVKCDCSYRGFPEYTGLREEITHREYRDLPHYLKECYERINY
jgi:hypothetical protein